MRLKPVLLLLLVVGAALSQTLPTGVRKTAAVAGITEYTFPNGLRVLLYPDSSSPKVTVNMTYLVGSRHEGYGETGMAHLLEHMNFLFSTHDRNVKKELTGHGASWNGTTGVDRTNYFETFTASDDNVKWALGLEAERMVNMRMEKALLDTEMTVVRNEFERGENNPRRILEERVVSTAYLWHNYGKSTIGTLADIEKVPIDRLAAFYRKYYQPDNAVLVIAGEFDPSKTLAWVAETCGSIPRPARRLDPMYTVEPVQDGERYVELRRVGTGKELIMLYHAPAMAHADAAALEMLTEILNGANGTGRLTKALVDNKKAVSAQIGLEELHDPGYVLASATLSDEQSIDDVRKTMLATIAGLVTEPPSKDEVERVKTRTLRRMERTLGNAQQLALTMTSMIADGDWRLYFKNYDDIKAVTPEDIVRVAKLYFKDSNRTVGVFIPDANPDRTAVPETPDLAALFKDYKGTIQATGSEAFDPAPDNIEKHVTRSKAPNGLRISLLPKASRTGTVLAQIELRFGDEKSLAGTHAAASLAGALLMRGTKTRTRQQLQDEMDKLDARIFAGGSGPGSAVASVQARAENLIPALRLAVEILREPAFPEADFDQLRAQEIAGIERGRTEPATLLREALQRHLNPYPKEDVRYLRTIDEQIADLKKVTLDDVKKFHARFYAASQGQFAAVGPFNPAEVQKAVAGLLGNWNAAAPWERIRPKYLPVAPVNLKIETPDKANAQFEAGLQIRMSDTDPDYPAMVLANYILGGSASGRLPDRIRNREGLSYGVNSGFSAASEGELASFRVAAIANPKNTPKVEASFRDELSKVLTAGLSADEVTAGKKALHDERVVGRSQDQALLSLILLRDNYDRTFVWDEQMDAKLAALTPEQVNAAFRRHIDPAAISIGKAGDFKAAAVYQ